MRDLGSWDKYYDKSEDYDLASTYTTKLSNIQNIENVNNGRSLNNNTKRRKRLYSERVMNESEDGLRWFRNDIQNRNLYKKQVNDDKLLPSSSRKGAPRSPNFEAFAEKVKDEGGYFLYQRHLFLACFGLYILHLIISI